MSAAAAKTPNETPVPASRGLCPAARPCPIHRCRYNLAVDDERPGRPHHGRRNLPIVVEKAESCCLDVVERNAAGLGTAALGALLLTSQRRIEQVIARATRKLQVVTVLDEITERARVSMPTGARLELVTRSESATVMVATIRVLIDPMVKATTPPPTRPRVAPEPLLHITRDERAAMVRTDPARPQREAAQERARARRAAKASNPHGSL